MGNSDISLKIGLPIAMISFCTVVYYNFFADKEINSSQYERLEWLSQRASSAVKPLFDEISSDGVIMKSEMSAFEQAVKNDRKAEILKSVGEHLSK